MDVTTKQLHLKLPLVGMLLFFGAIILPLKAQIPPETPIGMKNTTGTCYLNSGLQFLFRAKNFNFRLREKFPMSRMDELRIPDVIKFYLSALEQYELARIKGEESIDLRGLQFWERYKGKFNIENDMIQVVQELALYGDLLNEASFRIVTLDFNEVNEAKKIPESSGIVPRLSALENSLKKKLGSASPNELIVLLASNPSGQSIPKAGQLNIDVEKGILNGTYQLVSSGHACYDPAESQDGQESGTSEDKIVQHVTKRPPKNIFDWGNVDLWNQHNHAVTIVHGAAPSKLSYLCNDDFVWPLGQDQLSEIVNSGANGHVRTEKLLHNLDYLKRDVVNFRTAALLFRKSTDLPPEGLLEYRLLLNKYILGAKDMDTLLEHLKVLQALDPLQRSDDFNREFIRIVKKGPARGESWRQFLERLVSGISQH